MALELDWGKEGLGWRAEEGHSEHLKPWIQRVRQAQCAPGWGYKAGGRGLHFECIPSSPGLLSCRMVPLGSRMRCDACQQITDENNLKAGVILLHTTCLYPRTPCELLGFLLETWAASIGTNNVAQEYVLSISLMSLSLHSDCPEHNEC